jgi:MoxR-like ATPase
LADEINRTTPKVQSALLEAMQEYQVTIAWTTYKLDKPFFVLATQNPLEHEWTFPLPEAQIDRFLFKVNVTYPTHNDEKKIVVDNSNDWLIDLTPILNKDLLKNKFDKISKITVDDQIVNYAVRLTNATRDKKTWLDYWASPRWSISLVRAAKSVAFLEWRDYVVHKDIQSVALLVMRHRVIRNYDFDMEGNSIDDILLKIFSWVALSE